MTLVKTLIDVSAAEITETETIDERLRRRLEADAKATTVDHETDLLRSETSHIAHQDDHQMIQVDRPHEEDMVEEEEVVDHHRDEATVAIDDAVDSRHRVQIRIHQTREMRSSRQSTGNVTDSSSLTGTMSRQPADPKADTLSAKLKSSNGTRT